jgi:hypothetical protein
MLLKLLGLSDLAQSVTLLKAELDSVKTDLETLEKQFENTEIPDPDDFVLDCDFDDKVKDVIRYEISDKDDIKDEIMDEIRDEIEEQVRDLFNDASPAPMSKDEILNEVNDSVKVTLEKMCKALTETK